MNLSVQTACGLLKKGEVIAFPTETVYGLGADASNDQAVQKIFSIKGRPSFNPLIVHLLDMSWLKDIANIPDHALPLINQYWPGPLTIVVPLKKGGPIAPSVTAGLSTIGLRVPSHPLFRDLLDTYGKPIAAPSANTSNMLSCTTATHVRKSLGDGLFILEDQFPCAHGLESTIVDFSSPHPILLRHGAIAIDDIEDCVGPIMLSSATEKIKAPGQLKRHYAPLLPIRLNVQKPFKGEAFLNFGSLHPEETLNLSPSGHLDEAGAQLFKMLHLLDDPKKYKGIAVAPIPDVGLGQAINDRLIRASTLKEDL